VSLLHHSRVGQGEPLVILHGLFGSGKNWQSLARRFGERFDVISVDLRNHGQSFHADAMNYPAMTGDVVDLLDSLDLSRVNVLGHSMGGKVSMMLAATCPQRVDRLIVADIAPVAYAHSHDDLIDPIHSLSLETLGSREQADRFLASRIPQAGLRAFLLQNLVREDGAWRWRVNWRVIQRDMDQLTGFSGLADDWKVEHPTLFIRGASSSYVGDTELAAIHQHFSRARIETLVGAGHWLHAEQPQAFLQRVFDFLAET
jgi:esterase